MVTFPVCWFVAVCADFKNVQSSGSFEFVSAVSLFRVSSQRLVSCGRENVRFWRIRRQHLPACPAVLNDFARDLECTDLAFQRACHGIAGAVSDSPKKFVARVLSRALLFNDKKYVVFVSLGFGFRTLQRT